MPWPDGWHIDLPLKERDVGSIPTRGTIFIELLFIIVMRQYKICGGCKKQYVPPKGHARRRCPECPDGRWQFQSFEKLHKDGSRKRRLIEERGHRCEVCKGKTWMGKPIPIELDHIDGHPGHNEKKNLRLICPNCHSQQPTHAGANVGKHKGTIRQKVMARYPDYRAQKISTCSLEERHPYKVLSADYRRD